MTEPDNSSSGTERNPPEWATDLFPPIEWESKAKENVEKWGQQDLETLLLATQEELGELTQAALEARDEGGDPERIQEELNDLGALMYQIQWSLHTDTDH